MTRGVKYSLLQSLTEGVDATRWLWKKEKREVHIL